ncbi:class B sortase [Lacticaseibacillus thailandensis]|uniref:class B sortase n=1 Tax=Lacticaseibacillus thailandensis TaxID=381741 RepID=UPI0007050CED|nr:class B sortase [Lacticaseibacillus thailandensis]
MSKKGRGNQRLAHIIDLALIVVLVIGLFFGGRYLYQQHEVAHERAAAQRLTKQVTKKRHTNQTTMPAAGNISVNWRKLHQINPKIKAWIYVPGTRINYAVMAGSNNTYYLHHDERDQASVSGQIFIDYRDKPNFTARNTFLYGHNMYNGSMFAGLNDFLKQEFLNRHRHVYIYTPKKRYVGTVFAVQTNSGPSIAHTLRFSSAQKFANYLSYLKSRSKVKTNVKLKSIKKMATLWTCANDSTTGDAGQTVPVEKSRTFVSVALK